MDAETQVITVVTTTVPADREDALVEGFRDLAASSPPDGLLRTELLRGQTGTWQIQTLWRDLPSLQAVRKAGTPPAALLLLDRLGAAHTHTFFFVEHSRP